MDFAKINTRKNAETALTLHLTMVDSVEPLYADKAEKRPREIYLLGLESKVGRKAIAKMARKVTIRNQQNGQKPRSAKKITTEEILAEMDLSDDDKSEIYSEITTGWSEITYLPDEAPDDAVGVPLKFTVENAYLLYSTRGWILEQAVEKLEDRANFLPQNAPK